MSDYMEFSFDAGDDNVTAGKFDRFKAKAGETYRVSFVWWDMVNGKPQLQDGPNGPPSPRFTGAKRFYIQNAGYILDRGPEYAKIAGGPSKPVIATVIALWPVDKKGALDKAKFAAGEVEVKPWTFSPDKYEQLKRRNANFPFSQCDLNIVCTDTQFQKMDLSPCRESLFDMVLKHDQMRHVGQSILDKVVQIVGANAQGEPVGLRSMIARDMPLDKLREKLGGSAPVVHHENHSQPEVDSFLDQIIS